MIVSTDRKKCHLVPIVDVLQSGHFTVKSLAHFTDTRTYEFTYYTIYIEIHKLNLCRDSMNIFLGQSIGGSTG